MRTRVLFACAAMFVAVGEVPAQLRQVSNIAVGSPSRAYSAFMGQPVEFQDQLFFVAFDGRSGYVLCRTDGTTEGTRVLLTFINDGMRLRQPGPVGEQAHPASVPGPRPLAALEPNERLGDRRHRLGVPSALGRVPCVQSGPCRGGVVLGPGCNRPDSAALDAVAFGWHRPGNEGDSVPGRWPVRCCVRHVAVSGRSACLRLPFIRAWAPCPCGY